jgi:hypothetical protein
MAVGRVSSDPEAQGQRKVKWVSGIIAVVLLISAFGAGHRMGANGVQVDWDKDKLAQAAAQLAGQAKVAADLKAAHEAASAAVAAITLEKGKADANYTDAMRRIAQLRLRLDKISAGGVPPASSDPPGPASPASAAGLLESAATALAGCGRDYRSVAMQLEVVGRLTR